MNKMIRQLNRDILEALAARRPGGLSNRRALQEMMKAPAWTDGLAALFPIRERLSCARVLELCTPILDRICPQAPEKGWGPFCYQYICGVMYPGSGFAPEAPRYENGALFYLTVLQLLLDYERSALPFDPMMDFQFLTEEEYEACDKAREYRRFLAAWRGEFLYELMRLGLEYTPFKTLSHISGVHYIAMTAARGLAEAGVEVDLALISAAAAVHDVGKFGCRPGERVPYLHYYYTDQWLLERKMDDISHIASNHSTWDLELESLSVESLLLIYADFRSKSERGPQGEEIIILYPLDQSFQVILSKLDNVDRKKRRRYEFVYGKLHDFEDYMRRLGVDVDLTGKKQAPSPAKDPALMGPEETLNCLILLSVEHNLQLMHMLSNEQRFGNIIEAARSTKSWQQLRAYLNVFEEYFTYLSVRQKTQALSFLYELLMHREGDIRRQAGALIGQIIARFHLVYRKEIPSHAQNDPAEEVPFTLWGQYLDMIIFPDHKTTPQQRSHISYTLKLVVESMLNHARPGDIPRFLDALLQYYNDPEHTDDDTAFTLLDAARYLPPKHYGEETRAKLVDFAAHFSAVDDPRLVTAALQFLRETVRNIPRSHPQMARIADLVEAVPSSQLTTVFLKCRILRRAGRDVSALEHTLYHTDITSEVFLDNLKIATPWVVKVAGVELLRDQVEHGMEAHVLHIATHFSNLVKVSERVVVRHTAGSALVHTLSLLRREQRNEVVVELGKGLEMGQYEISKYIPQYLGEAALYLHPSELDEQVLWLKGLLGSPNDSAVAGALNTIAVLLQHYPAYQQRFSEKREVYTRRRRELLGLLLQGLAHYRETVRQEALLVTGKLLFESPILGIEEKAHLFSLSYRKLLFLTQESSRQDGLTFFYRAAALAHINRFIALRRLDYGPFTFEKPRKIAFFPGTFDPFTLSHKGIVHAIRDLGFEVYLAVDEFSWSKKAQPHLIRRQIVNLSVAGDFHVHLFPDDIPVNIANPADLRRLTDLFPDQKVYIVAGSDVVANASSYKAQPQPFSIHQMNHVIFRRAGEKELPAPLPITGEVIQLQLPPHLEDISSTRIRENVDLNRDISNFIDPVIQDFIYQNGLYLRDSQEKPMLGTGDLEFQWVGQPDPILMDSLTAGLSDRGPVCAAVFDRGDWMLLLRQAGQGEILGYIAYRSLSTSQLFAALGDTELANRVRLRAAGNTLLITALSVVESERFKDYRQLLLCELLARALEEDCVYAVFCPHDRKVDDKLEDVLIRTGFLVREEGQPIWETDMHAPATLIQNLETTIQDPLSRNPRVLAAIRRSHQSLQRALARLYPGSLLLTLSADIIHQRLLEKITAYNNVPAVPTTPRVLGENMCVPYGKLLRGKTVPNTVTKTIHTDRVYSPDLSESVMEPFPYYAPISSQIRTIKSFDRPVILVDDLMHPGFRFKALDPILRREGVPIRMVLVGVLSGYGKDLMDHWERPVDSVYFLPTLRQWFIEATLYPFIGGNTVRRSSSPVPGLLPGINHILPYASPVYQEPCAREAVFQLSKACLEGALDIIRTLEQEYRILYGRNLTLARLPEAVILPLCPDKGTCLHYDPTLSASVYLENDLEQLLRQNQ
ncbi:cytidyltransferase-related domain protein [Flintibacter muris]|uniref:cytidyltransferase-related domain protein n=1 Tax=Flintibacter muris TaxID=2941327 RepID=UPI00203E6849|nr:cytidyltransferase-related domain protein [Flintibacter muris]